MSEETSEMPPPQSEEPLTRDQQINIEREEEKKLKAKYPQVHGPRGIGGRPPGVGPAPGPHSAFLQKRLAKGQKYFDSGDYQMAKQKSRLPGAGIPGTVVAPAAPAASAAAAPPAMAAPSSGGGPSRLTIPTGLQPTPATGETIPTPELVPMRKTSIIQPLHDHSTSMHLASDPAHVEPGRPMPNPAVAKLTS